MVTTCSTQLISHCVNAKITPTSVKEVNKTSLSLHVDPTSCYYKSHGVNWPLIDFYFLLEGGEGGPLPITSRGVPF